MPRCIGVFALAPCRFLRFKEKWKKLGSLKHTSWGKPQRTVWLSERPARRGGMWGIGCNFCAHLVHTLARYPEERKRLCPGFKYSRKFVFMPRKYGALCPMQNFYPAASTRLRMGSRASAKWGTFDVRSRSCFILDVVNGLQSCFEG